MRRMQRFLLAASLIAAACGSTQPQHSTAPRADKRSEAYDPNEMVCVDEEFAPRGATGQHCRRRADIDVENARGRDAIEHAIPQNRTK